MFYIDPSFTISFGNKETAFEKHFFHTIPTTQILAQQPPFAAARNQMRFNKIITLNQTHSIQGAIFTHDQECATYRPYSKEGDFLITSVKNVALGVATADCLPLVLYDPHNQLVAIIHAGWKGAVHNIIGTVIDQLKRLFGTHPSHVHAFLGPCARVCCYKITPEFITNIEPFKRGSVREKGETLYFDLPLYSILCLQEKGLSENNICLDYNICTICNTSYCSYRRQGPLAQRQMTLVSLV